MRVVAIVAGFFLVLVGGALAAVFLVRSLMVPVPPAPPVGPVQQAATPQIAPSPLKPELGVATEDPVAEPEELAAPSRVEPTSTGEAVVELGNPAVRGSLSREIIQRVVRRHQMELVHCYEQGLARDPQLPGRVTLRWIISEDGRVQSAMIGAMELHDQQVESCLIERVSRWTFPAPNGGIVIVNAYPVVFDSTSTPPPVHVRGEVSVSLGGDVGGAGDFDDNLVVAQIRARLRAIQSCYEGLLPNNPTLAGRIRVRFTIVEEGAVVGATATENSANSAALADCVIGVVRRFRFNPGPTNGAVDFEYWFVFRVEVN